MACEIIDIAEARAAYCERAVITARAEDQWQIVCDYDEWWLQQAYFPQCAACPQLLEEYPRFLAAFLTPTGPLYGRGGICRPCETRERAELVRVCEVAFIEYYGRGAGSA